MGRGSGTTPVSRPGATLAGGITVRGATNHARRRTQRPYRAVALSPPGVCRAIALQAVLDGLPWRRDEPLPDGGRDALHLGG